MNSSLSDPNNHVPELTPGDDWGDDEEAQPVVSSTAAVLPPRRSISDRSASTTEPAKEVGLRIEPQLTRVEASDMPTRLEVQEISGSVVRLEQTTPAPPKVERQLKFHERPVKEEDEARKEGDAAAWGASKSHSTRWLLISGASIVGIVILGLMALPSINAPNKDRSKGKTAVSHTSDEDEIEGAAAMNRLIARQPEAMQLFRSYATASRWDEVVSLMREDQAKDESLRVHWKPLGVSKQWSLATDCLWSADKLGDDYFGTLTGELPDHTQFAAYFIRSGDQLLLDWKATTGFGTATFEQLANGGGDPQEIRGKISPTEFYTAAWPEADYQSYRFEAPDGGISIWCYTPRNELANSIIAPLFNQGVIVQESKDSLQVTLRLQRGPGDASPNQWAIGEVHFKGWVKPLNSDRERK